MKVTVGSFTGTANYGQGSTNATIASALASALSVATSPVTATASGNVVSLTSKATGSASNYPLSVSWTWDTAHFASASFIATTSGSTLTGGTDCAGRQETYDYNNRLQPVRIQLGTSTNNSANSCLVYNYYSSVANPTSCAVPSQATSGNNGNVMGQLAQNTTNPSLGHTATYTYDNVMRLATAAANNLSGGTIWSQTYNYDRFGNMSCVSGGVAGCNSTITYAPNTTTNRITTSGYTYDGAGNLTADGTGVGTHTYQWDAENRMTSIDSGTTASYTYNALGQRVEKNVGGAYTEAAYDATGEEIGDNNRTSWTQSFVLFQGRHLVHYQNGKAYFNHANSVGSTAQVTDNTGAIVQDQLYYPWGQDWAMVGAMQERPLRWPASPRLNVRN